MTTLKLGSKMRTVPLKAKPYHIVVSKEKTDGAKWQMEFGDYDAEVAKQEMVDLREGYSDVKKVYKTHMLTCDTQEVIDAFIAELNDGK